MFPVIFPNILQAKNGNAATSPKHTMEIALNLTAVARTLDVGLEMHSKCFLSRSQMVGNIRSDSPLGYTKGSALLVAINLFGTGNLPNAHFGDEINCGSLIGLMLQICRPPWPDEAMVSISDIYIHKPFASEMGEGSIAHKVQLYLDHMPANLYIGFK
ncbi:hypothetical protein K7432_015698 [Basidiobolus ranarum]|uniref:Uncharacterized protein n=1 Tax=Basidiobolus ranarum TaxID=34480 RepID=A0ABR2VMQ6_9FUNG